MSEDRRMPSSSDPRVLILGGAGMLGHMLWRTLSARFETYVTLRSLDPWRAIGLFDPARTIEQVDAGDPRSLDRALDETRPTVVINCIGLVKQRPEARDPVAAIAVNALFPQLAARASTARAARFIQISTDCVFSGRRGDYVEDDLTDAEDLYGRTKALGEVTAPGCLTLRTSIIGREIGEGLGLVEWFLSRRDAGTCQGYTRAWFSGVTTAVLARFVGDLIARRSALSGLYHLGGPRINKHDLVRLLNDAYDAGVSVEPVAGPHIDRTLNAARLRRDAAFDAPSWAGMCRDLAADAAPYDSWRRALGRPT
jgi:dTDP-4-dehydrorhamnose reductase